MSQEPRCLVALSAQERTLFFPNEVTRPFDRILPHARYVEPPFTHAAWEKLLSVFDPEILVSCWETPPIPEGLASLRYVCHVAGSVRAQVSKPLIERGVRVTNWGESASESVAEAALLLTLSALRRSHDVARIMHIERGWAAARGGTSSLYDRHIGLHGFGAVARRLVALLQPFRPKISAYSEGVPLKCYQDLGVRPCESLAALFRGAEILIEVEALNARTRGSVDREMLSLLRPGAVFVNVGRGGVVDETALVERARTGTVRLALDVYADEPLSPDSPLRGLSNVVLFAHSAGPTDDAFPACGQFAFQNLARYCEGATLQGVITAEAYDRAT